jgi:VCBS repeat-containing protein
VTKPPAPRGAVDLSFSAASTAFDYLAKGEVLTLTYTVQVDDHHGGVVTKPVTVTITGSNDTPTLAAELAGKLTDTAANDGFGNITGVLDGSDADHGETATLSYRVVDAEGHATNSPLPARSAR